MTAKHTDQHSSALSGQPLNRSNLIFAVRTVFDRQTQNFPSDIHLRFAEVSDIPVLESLNAVAIRDLGREGLFLRMSDDFLAEMIRDGVIILPTRDRKILGYSIAVPADSHHPPFLFAKEQEKTGLLFGTMLDQSLRGQGWQCRLILTRLESFREAGAMAVEATVSPFNITSLRNLLSAGFHVAGLKTLLDGHPRFLLRHDFGRTTMAGPFQKLILPQSGDLSDHSELLSNGFVAIRVRTKKTSTLLYATGSAAHHPSGELAG